MFVGKSQKTSKKFVRLFLLIIIVSLACCIAFSASSARQGEQAQALTSTGVTMLSTGNGLVYGDNPLRLTNVTPRSLPGDSASEGSQKDLNITQTSPNDFYISGNISVNEGVAGFLGSAGHSSSAYINNQGSSLAFASYPKTLESNIAMSTRIGVSSSLIAAIRDPMLTVTANAYFV
ncbi:MAG: hypothetical protein PHC84_03425, partial [Clostridia bacterium]|nr:hypothetical protein [Clostridia bacterium]